MKKKNKIKKQSDFSHLQVNILWLPNRKRFKHISKGILERVFLLFFLFFENLI